MKKFWKEILTAAVLGIAAPAIALVSVTGRNAPLQETTGPMENANQTLETQITLSVIKEDGEIDPMELEEYLVGVVLREMPADFEVEAQKAQAVVARTYALRCYESGKKHPGGAVCTDSGCCQGYLSPEAFLDMGGTEAALEQVRQAVAATRDEVLIYEGKLIEATYFSCSGGRTEDAVAVWGSDVPYLRSTDSPGEEGATHYTDTVTFTPREFSAALGADLQGQPDSWLGEITHTQGGGVESMVIGGVTYKGTTLRQMLGLRSTAFTMTAIGNEIVVTTRGFGHRVGMSQYGAEAMAVSGSTYDDILEHYYQGTRLTAYSSSMD